MLPPIAQRRSTILRRLAILSAFALFCWLAIAMVNGISISPHDLNRKELEEITPTVLHETSEPNLSAERLSGGSIRVITGVQQQGGEEFHLKHRFFRGWRIVETDQRIE
jgi:hypothetical protein